MISIHALLAESDKLTFCSVISILNFYPRSPCGERPDGSTTINLFEQFLSTLSLRRATHTFAPLLHDFVISIHALLAESDQMPAAQRLLR